MHWDRWMVRAWSTPSRSSGLRRDSPWAGPESKEKIRSRQQPADGLRSVCACNTCSRQSPSQKRRNRHRLSRYCKCNAARPAPAKTRSRTDKTAGKTSLLPGGYGSLVPRPWSLSPRLSEVHLQRELPESPLVIRAAVVANTALGGDYLRIAGRVIEHVVLGLLQE